MKKLFLLLLILLVGSDLPVFAQLPIFKYTGTVQTWQVPCGVDTIVVLAVGAQGGMAGGTDPASATTLGGPTGIPTTPGSGGLVQARVAVVPGQILNIYVGGAGGLGNPTTGGAGGWNGGGHADPHAWSPSPLFSGGGGGGASDVRLGGVSLTDRVVVAGGGGGAGYNGSCPTGDQPGGDAGGLTGSSVITCSSTLLGLYTITLATGGTQAAGGIGGNLASSPPLYTAGNNGASGIGGSTALLPLDAGIAGGGGGGYNGGGGGCWMGGGGGSSYTNALLTASVTLIPGYNNTGDGKVSICLTSAGTITGIAPLCSGYTLPLSSTVCGGTWSTSNASIATIGSTTGIVKGVAGGTVFVTYTMASACGAVTAVTTIKIIQSPLPIVFTNPLCVGSSAILSDPTPGGFWSSSNTTLATVNPSTGVVTGIYPGNPIISYTNPVAGCAATFSLNVHGISGIFHVCDGTTIPLFSSDPGGTWTSSDATVATVNAGGVVTGISLGTATISYSSLVCPSGVTVTVNPVAPIVAADSICASSTAYFTNVVGGGVWISNNIKAATVAPGTGLVTGINAGTVIISYLLPTGCLSVHNTTVIALPPPITGKMDMCPGGSTALTDPLAGGTWASSNTTVATVNTNTGVVTGVVADTAYVYYTIKPGCAVNTMVTVNPIPFPITGIDTICPGAVDTLKDSSIGGLWSTTTPTMDTIVDTTGRFITKLLSGVYAIVNYTLPTSCTISKKIYIYPTAKPVVTYNWPLNTFYATPGYPHYQWYDSVTGRIPNATSPSLATVYYEWFYLVVTDSNGCKIESDTIYHELSTLGTKNISSADIKIYPNPASGILYITSPVKVRAVLSGVDGKIEMEMEDAKELDISRLADATYFISLYDESGQLITVKKVVKE